jgi:hypothetical protein
MTQSIFTFITKVDPARLSELEAYLAQVRKNVPRDPDLPFASLPMLHFASFVIFYDDTFGPYLVFENNVDGTPQAYLDALLDAALPALHRIYGMCLEYDGNGSVDRARLRAFLLARLVLPDAGYIGNVGRSVGRIKDESALRAALETYLDTLVTAGTAASAGEIFAKLRAFALDGWGWALSAQRRIGRIDLALRWGALIALAVLAFVLWPVAGPLLLLFAIVLRVHEVTGRVDIPPPDHKAIAALAANEDRIVQNHMASLCYLKPGRFRLNTLRFVLFLTKLVARVSVSGKLIGLNSLHFAHWVIIDDGRRLLFMTNYDGSWENYLDDFIDKAAIGLTAIWSNTLNFPRTTLLVFGGARDERKFKAIARKTQAFTNVGYSAYPMLTVPAIDNNSAIRDGLATPPAGDAVEAWLQRL